MTVKKAYDLIEDYYERMCKCTSTQGRKNNYYGIVNVMDECPKVKEYWVLVNDAFLYVDRVKRINLYVELTPSNYKTSKDEYYEDEISYAYILHLEERNQLKVGKTKDWGRRMYDLSKQYGRVTELYSFEFNSEEEALIMESILHTYYKKFYPCEFYPNDRFDFTPLTEKDIKVLEIAAENIRKINWFNPLTRQLFCGIIKIPKDERRMSNVKYRKHNQRL